MTSKHKFQQRYIISILLQFFLFSCQTSKNENPNITVSLEKTEKDIGYYDNRQSQFLLLSMKDFNPDFYRKNLAKLKGIPELDSFQVVTENLNKRYFFTALSRRDYDQRTLVDSLRMSPDNSKEYINIISGFKNGKQLLIVDTNNNNHFNDENIFSFDDEYRFFQNNNPDINDKLEKVDSLPFLEIEYYLNASGNVKRMKRIAQFYPFANNFYTQLLGESNVKNYAIGMRTKDYWIGTLPFQKVNYSVVVQGLNDESSTVMIKPEQFEFDPKDKSFNQNFSYKISDSVQLSNQLFVLDSLRSDFSKLFLRRVDRSNEYFGNRIGNEIKDFHMHNLDGKDFALEQVINSNKVYTLIDFWGTWCAPCKELTPELVRISKENPEKLNILSIAADKNIQEVKAYTLKNKMNWYHGFEKLKNRDGIRKELKISSYPTFILLNEKREIIYRGGSRSIIAIEEIIKN